MAFKIKGKMAGREYYAGSADIMHICYRRISLCLSWTEYKECNRASRRHSGRFHIYFIGHDTMAVMRVSD